MILNLGFDGSVVFVIWTRTELKRHMNFKEKNVISKKLNANVYKFAI